MEENLKNRLLNYTEPPNKKIWEQVSFSLETDTEINFSNKLLSFEQKPPFGTWNKIIEALQLINDSNTIPFYKKHKRFLTYGAAAAIIIGFAFSLNLIFSKTAEGDVAQIPFPDNQASSIKQPQQKNSEASNDYLQEDNNVFLATTNKDVVKKKRKYAVQIAALKPEDLILSEHLGKIVIPAPKVAELSNLERYIVSMNSSGNVAKLPKKVYDFISCPDEYTKEDCKRQLQSIQQKVAKPALIASADFTGILEMLKSLQENQ